MSDASRGMDRAFERFAGACAIAVGAGGVAYAITFVIVVSGNAGRGVGAANAGFLLLGGLLSTAVLVAVYRRVQPTSPSLALWALLLGVIGAAGATIHGGFELAYFVKPPVSGTRGVFASPIDPRGLLTFAVTAIAIFAIAWLIVHGGSFPKRLGYLGYVSATLLMVLYLGRLVILNPKNPLLLISAVLAGFVVNPAWYVWLGLELRREVDGQGHGRSEPDRGVHPLPAG
jgi:hypothetical protein